MQGCRTLSIAILLTSVACGARMEGAEIRMRSEVQCGAGLVVLGDLAEVFATEQAEMERLSNIELFPAPTGGEKRFVTVREVRDMVALKGANLAGLTFSGASRTTIVGVRETSAAPESLRTGISGGARRVATDRATAALVAYLNEQTANETQWIVRLDLSEEQVLALADAEELRVAEGGTAPWLGRQRFWLTGAATGGEAGVEVVADVSLPAMIVVAARTLPRGAVVHAADVQVQASRPHESQLASFGRLEDVVGQELRRSIGAGQALTDADLQAPVLVRRGDPVTVYARSPGIQVRTTARAVEDGALGELITVESLNDRRKFFASVSGIQEVEVYARAAAAESVRPVATIEATPASFRGP